MPLASYLYAFQFKNYMNFYLRIILSSLIICVYSSFGQDLGKISGKVTDNNSQPLEADVKLLNQTDSLFVSGAKCDANGIFSIENIPFGSYKMEVSFTGYSKVDINNIALNNSNPSRVFDTLKLGNQNVTTDEILIEEDKGLIQLGPDKKIFNVSKSELNKGGTALDVLKKTPLVDVDINDNVSMRGSQNVKILIDDKPSRYASLKQVPADAIERIELITNPPAKYEAEGVTGIINIVMKKSDKVGFTGNLNGGANYIEKLSGWGGIDLNIKKKKTALFGNFYSGTWANVFSYNSVTSYFTQPATSLNSFGSGNNHGYWIWAQSGIEYEFSEGKSMGFEGSLGTGKWYNSDNGTGQNLNSSSLVTSYYDQANNRDGLWENFTGSMYFNNKMKEGRELSGDITYSRNRNENRFAMLKQDYDSLSFPSNDTPLDQRDSTQFKNSNLNVQTDFTLPVSKISKIETGYKGTFRVNDNNFHSDTLNYSLNNYVTNNLTQNHFKLNEYINALYGVFSSSIGADFSYKFGVRVEQTDTKGELLSQEIDFTQSYLDVFPSASLSQKIGKTHQLQLAYSRRVTRPNIWRLNPFFRKWSPRFAVVGNPALKPEYSDSYELSFMFFSKIATFTPLLFYRQNHDVISNYSFLADSNVTVTTYRNAAGSKAYGTDLLINSSPLKWLSLNGTLSLYNTEFDSDPLMTDYASEDGFSWRANLRSTLSFKELFNVELYYTYTGKKINAQGIEIPSSYFDIALSRSFLDETLTISLKAGDVFNTAKWGQEVYANDYTQKLNNDWSSRQASLNLSLKFGNTDQAYQKNKKVKQNSNEKSDQQDSNGR